MSKLAGIGALIMHSRQINNLGRQMGGPRRLVLANLGRLSERLSESSKASIQQVLVYSLIVMLLAPAMALILTTRVEVVVASPDPENVAYDFTDNENNRAWEDADAALTLLTPPNVPGGSDEASSAEYTAISASDDSWWETVGGESEYEFHYFKFKIFETISEIDNFTVHWKGKGAPESFYFLIWNSDSSEWVELQSHASSASDVTFENTFTEDISHYIYENAGAGENQIWLAVRSQAAASCPTLYIWDGERYVSYGTASSAGGLGFPTPQGFYDSNPKSYEVLPDETIKIENGFYRIALGEELDEICYQDVAKLYKVYHPIGTHVISGTVTHPLGPCTNNEIYLVKDLRPPLTATYESGENILPIISDIDGRATSGVMGEFDRIILDLGDLSQAKQIKLVMKMYTEWLNEFTMESSYAEVVDENGDWVRVSERIDSLPEYTKHPQNKLLAIDITDWFLTDNYWLRLNDFHNKHWDFIGVDTSSDEILAWRELDLATADLYRKGQSVLHHDPIGDWWEFDRTFEVPSKYSGYFTRYGNVKPLLENSDDIYVIMLAGDAIELRFESRVNFLDLLVARGSLERTFVFESDGWYKEEWTKFLVGENVCKVEPLPFHAMSYYPYPENEEYPWTEEQVEWWVEYQTRYIKPNIDSHNTLRTDYVKVNVYITTIKPTQPILYLPSDGDNVWDSTPYLEWENAENADSHRLLIDNDSDFTSPEENRVIVGENHYTIANENVLPMDNYSWKVIAINENGENSSATWTFNVITIKPTQPTLHLPSDGDDFVYNFPYFEWTNGENADNHRLLVDNDNDFSSPKENRIFTTENYYSPVAENIFFPDNYSWKVIAINENGENVSATWTFVISGVWTTPSSIENVCGEEGGFAATKIIDENTDSYWKHDVAHFHAITFDMGRTLKILKIMLYQATTADLRFGRAAGLTVYVSDNVDNWGDNVCECILNAPDWQENGNIFDKDGRYIKLVSKDNYNARMYEFLAYVTAGLPTQPTLYLPSDGNYLIDNTPYFEWENGAYADNHRLLVDNDSDFSSPEEDRVILNDNSYTIADENYLPVDNYSWKVIAINQYGENESDVWTFQTEIFELFYPENNSIIVDRTPKFLWNERTGATFYWFYLDNDSDLENEPLLKTRANDNFYQIPWGGLITNENWYWKVIASDSSATSVFNFVENGAEVTTEDIENITENSGDLLASIVLNALDDFDVRFRYKSEYQYQTEGDTFVIQDYSVPDPPALPTWRQENVMIAASDSSQEDKDAADNICPGPDENEVWKDDEIIQAAIAENTTVYLFDGTYYCGRDGGSDAQIIITSSRLSLVGESKENVIIRWKQQTYLRPSAIRVSVENAENILFENFTLIGPGRTFSGEFSGLHLHSYGGTYGSIHDVVVRNIKVENFPAIGIYFERSGTEVYEPPRTQTLYNCWAINCEIDEVGAYGFDAGGFVADASTVHVWNIYFDNIRVTNCLGSPVYSEAGGAHFHRIDNSMIVNCTFENIGRRAIRLGSNYKHLRNIQILGNTFERCGLIVPAEDIGIHMYYDNCEDIRIEGNDFDTFWAIKIWTDAENTENVVIRNNSFYNCVEPFENLQGWEFDIENNTAPNFDNFTPWENNYADTDYSYSLTGLDESTKYGVIAETENNGDNSWGRANYFTTLGTENIDLSEPENDFFTSLRPTFKWSAVKNRSYYKLQIDTSDNFDSANVIDHNLMENEYTLVADLDNGVQHWWRVIVYPTELTSEVWIFTTIPPEWRHIENWTGTLDAYAEWSLIETWTRTLDAFAEWGLIETWTGTVEAFAEWGLIEEWTGTVETHAAWQLVEEWGGDIEAPASWILVETWSGTVHAVVGWELIETWTGTVEAYAEWNLIEAAWSGTVEAFAEWNLIETWTGTIETFAEWNLIETWTGGLQHLLASVTTESATSIGQTFATLNALVTYGSYENVDIRFQYRVDGASTWENAAWENDYTAILYSDTVFGLSAGTTYEFRGQIEFGAFSDNGEVVEFTTQALAPDWELIETWTGTIDTQVAWGLLETWGGDVEAYAAWENIEAWTGTVDVVTWTTLETWSGTIMTVAPAEDDGNGGNGGKPDEPEEEEPTPTMIPLGIGAVLSLLIAGCFIYLSAFKPGSRKRRWARNFIYIIATATFLTMIYVKNEGIALSKITMVVGVWVLIFVVALLHLTSIEAGSWRQRMTKQFFCVLITLTVLTLIYLGVI